MDTVSGSVFKGAENSLTEYVGAGPIDLALDIRLDVVLSIKSLGVVRGNIRSELFFYFYNWPYYAVLV